MKDFEKILAFREIHTREWAVYKSDFVINQCCLNLLLPSSIFEFYETGKDSEGYEWTTIAVKRKMFK